jgi:hypothetical protein
MENLRQDIWYLSQHTNPSGFHNYLLQTPQHIKIFDFHSTMVNIYCLDLIPHLQGHVVTVSSIVTLVFSGFYVGGTCRLLHG